MNIRQLQVFQAVCDTLSFTRAAEALYMTQPAVSHTIRDLEQEVGCRLFERLNRRIDLTAAGRLFREKTTRLLELYDELANHFDGMEESGLLRLGSSITIANVWLPSILQKFHAVCEKTPVQVEVDKASSIEARLERNEVDLALLEGPVHSRVLEARVFSSYEMAVICAPESPLAGRVISPAAFAAAELLLREKGSAIRDAVDSALLLRHLSAAPVWTSVNSRALIQAVRHNLGISVLPAELVQGELEAGQVAQVWVEGMTLSNQSAVVWHRDKYLTRAMRTLMDIAAETGRSSPGGV